MKSSTFALVASFATTIVASPYHLAQHAERDVVVVTATDVHVDYVDVTQWVTAGAPQVTTAVTVTASSSASEEVHGNNRKFGPGGDHSWSWQHSESAPAFSAPPPPAPTTSTTSTTAPAFSWPAPESTSTTAPAFSWPAPSSTTTTAAPSTTAAATTAQTYNNPGTNTAGMSYTAPVSPYPQPSSWSNDGAQSYNPFDGDLQQGSLNATNFWRNQYGAQSVVWNYTVEADLIAIDNNKYQTQCSFDHPSYDWVHGSGSNIAGGYGSPSEAIDGWGGEVYHTTPANFTNGDFGDSLHFSQLVWQDTTSIACAAIDCSHYTGPNPNVFAGWFYICAYYPAGNMGGEYQANVKPKSS